MLALLFFMVVVWLLTGTNDGVVDKYLWVVDGQGKARRYIRDGFDAAFV